MTSSTEPNQPNDPQQGQPEPQQPSPTVEPGQTVDDPQPANPDGGNAA